MRIIAAACIGVFCASIVGSLLGVLPTRPLRSWPRGAGGARRYGQWLEQAGAAVTPAQFVGGSLAAAFVALLVLVAVTGSVFVALVPAIAVACFPRAYFARRRRQRMREVQEAWPDGLRDLVTSIAAGRSLTQAISSLAATGPPALREAFGRFPNLARVVGTAAALEIVKAELADPTSDRVIEVLLLANERGGGIVRTILEDLIDATTGDLKLADEIETEGLETRINARAVVVLPWFVLVALTAKPGPFRTFYRSGGGVATLSLAGLLTIVGLVVLGRLGRSRDEERVLVPADGVR